jgi:hypothetical protein
MSPELIYGNAGVIACCLYAIVWLVKQLEKERRTNDTLRDASMELLKKYQERDEEERRWRVERDRERAEGKT